MTKGLKQLFYGPDGLVEGSNRVSTVKASLSTPHYVKEASIMTEQISTYYRLFLLHLFTSLITFELVKEDQWQESSLQLLCVGFVTHKTQPHPLCTWWTRWWSSNIWWDVRLVAISLSSCAACQLKPSCFLQDICCRVKTFHFAAVNRKILKKYLKKIEILYKYM